MFVIIQFFNSNEFYKNLYQMKTNNVFKYTINNNKKEKKILSSVIDSLFIHCYIEGQNN